jgi:hypothetical protein
LNGWPLFELQLIWCGGVGTIPYLFGTKWHQLKSIAFNCNHLQSITINFNQFWSAIKIQSIAIICNQALFIINSIKSGTFHNQYILFGCRFPQLNHWYNSCQPLNGDLV